MIIAVPMVVIDVVMLVSSSNSGSYISTHLAVYCEKTIVRINSRTQAIP